MSLLALSGTNSVSGGYEISNSCKFERANGEQIFTSNAAAGNRRTWTFSAWIKRTQLSQDYSTVFSCGYSNIQFMSNDRPRLILYNGSSEVYADPEMLMRDTSAWYHIVVQVDSTQSTASDRVKWWINGDRITDFNNSTYTNMSQNEEFDFGQAGSGSGNWLRLGEFFGGSEGFGGYMAEVHYLNGTAAQASDFGEYDSNSGIWIPKEYTGGGYGTQGFYYKFDNASNLGEDSSGEGHDANNLSNITSADQATDTPTNNFATWNVNYNYTSSVGNPTITEGATKTAEGTGGWAQAKATMGVTSGKWYWEYKMGGYISWMGVQDDTASQTEVAGQYTLFLYNGDTTVEINDTGSLRDDTVLSYTFSTSDIYAVALNMDDNEISYYQNGSIIGSAISLDGLADRLLLPYIGTNSSTNETNFGGYTTISISTPATDENGYGTFEYAPPSGYYALCTKNLAEYG